MSYKLALFAFPESIENKTILKELSIGVDTVAADVPFKKAFICLEQIESLKFAFILAQGRSPGSGVLRGTITEGFYGTNYPAAFLGYDDQNGVSLFEGLGAASLTLLSDGCVIMRDPDYDACVDMMKSAVSGLRVYAE